MAAGQEQEHEPRKLQYPLDSTSYRIISEIGVGVSAVVYKAICTTMNSSVVAIKAIDLDQSRADFDNVRREAKTMSLLSHPNILNAHCSFTVDRRLWVVMPFMSAGSLQSIITSSFPDGLSESCIAIVLKEILNALSYLHGQGHLHRDIKAGNILIDSNGSVKLADFGVSASIYESNSVRGWYSSSSSFSSSSLMLTDVAGTPYWMAPEVIHSHNGYSFKADIWSFGITALELAHGRPPLSNLPLSKSLLLKITKRFRFSDYDKNKKEKQKKFSKSFKDMVASCLDQDPSKRPTAEKLLKHSFFKNCKGTDFLVKNVLQGLPSVEERFKASKILNSITTKNDEEDDDGDDELKVKHRRISGWNFNEDGFQLDPVFPTETNGAKQVTFGKDSFIQDKGGDSSESNLSSPGQISESASNLISPIDHSDEIGGGVDREPMLGSLMVLMKSLEEQKKKVSDLIGLLGGEEHREMTTRADQMVQVIERLRVELENEKRKNFELEIELEYLKLQVYGAQSPGA
ncbi:hypothetical protein FNV43_RR01501 [Rhamnella rubrinervis]|uniref:Protein kinase domain-containing protein n=1 Tax=Rhamnella rubrinervis TaxID=2594499 RepID=A0A8K0MSC2_9ROSA|nr:hypothetical protein FNV43_RR01501 [Rhamnella rubrinervis]